MARRISRGRQTPPAHSGLAGACASVPGVVVPGYLDTSIHVYSSLRRPNIALKLPFTRLHPTIDFVLILNLTSTRNLLSSSSLAWLLILCLRPKNILPTRWIVAWTTSLPKRCAQRSYLHTTLGCTATAVTDQLPAQQQWTSKQTRW